LNFGTAFREPEFESVRIFSTTLFLFHPDRRIHYRRGNKKNDLCPVIEESGERARKRTRTFLNLLERSGISSNIPESSGSGRAIESGGGKIDILFII
jgi:hypothetical protein